MWLMGTFVASMVILWIFFVVVMYLKKQYLEGKIPKWMYWILMPFVVIGYLFDVAFNIVFGTLMFTHLPEFADAHVPYLPTLSERLRDILRGARRVKVGGFQWKMALFICRYLIEPWDKNHCGLCDLELCKDKS